MSFFKGIFSEDISSSDPFVQEILFQKINKKYKTPLEEFQARFAALAEQKQWVIHQETLAENRATYEGLSSLHKKWADVTGQAASDTQFVSVFHAPKDKSLISAANELMQAGFPASQEEEDRMAALANKFNKDFATAEKQLHIAAPRDVVLDLLKEKDGLDIHKATREFIYGDPKKAAYRENLFHTLITTHEGLEAYHLPGGYKHKPSLMSATIGSHVSMDVVKSEFKTAEILGIDALKLMSRYRRDELEYLSTNPVSEFSIAKQDEYIKQLSGILDDVDKYTANPSSEKPAVIVDQRSVPKLKKRTRQHIQERIKERKVKRQKAKVDKLQAAAAEIPIDHNERDLIPFISPEYNKTVRPSRALHEQVNKELEVLPLIEQTELNDRTLEAERLKEERWRNIKEQIAEEKHQRNIRNLEQQAKERSSFYYHEQIENKEEAFLRSLSYEEQTPEQRTLFEKERAVARQQQAQAKRIAQTIAKDKRQAAFYEKINIASTSKLNDARAGAEQRAAEWAEARTSRWESAVVAPVVTETVEEKVSQQLFNKARVIPKAHIIAGAGALLFIGSHFLGNRFSGKDDAYNTIEGLPHGGLAEQQRKLLTDFSSPWQGLFGGVSRKITKYMASARNTIYNELLPIPEQLLDPRKAYEMMKTSSLEEMASRFSTKLTIVKDAESKALYESLLKRDKGFAGGAAAYISGSGEYSMVLNPEVLSKQFTEAAARKGMSRELAESVTKSDDFLKTVFYHELLEQQARLMFTKRIQMPTGHISAHVLIGEGGFVTASKNNALKQLFTTIRSGNKSETAALHAGFEAFGETGVSPKLRKLITDFGSRYRGLLGSTSLNVNRSICLNKRATQKLVLSSRDLKIAQKQIWKWANGAGKSHNKYAGSHIQQLSRFGGIN